MRPPKAKSRCGSGTWSATSVRGCSINRPLPERLAEAFDQWAGRCIGPLTRDVTVVVEDNPDLLGEIVETTPRRFEKLITDAIAVESGQEAATPVAQTMISASIGLKNQAASREFYLERLKVAIELLVR